MCKNEYFIIANINSFEMVTFLLKVFKKSNQNDEQDKSAGIGRKNSC